MVEQRPRNVFSVCPDEPTSVAPVRRKPKRTTDSRGEYKICKASSHDVVRICVGQITISDLFKAAKCAKIVGDFKVYRNKSFTYSNSLKQSDFPYKGDVYISKAQSTTASVPTPAPAPAPTRRSGTKLFTVCPEGMTSVAPVQRSTESATTSSMKKQLLNKAIVAFKSGISSLEALSEKL